MHIDISAKLAPYFPLGSRPVEISVQPGATGSWMPASEVDSAIATIRLIVFDRDDQDGGNGNWMVRDIKEQEINLGFPALYDNADRLAAFFAALGKVLDSIPLETIGELMPDDLLVVDALKLKRAQTEADFDEALRAKSRLGKYL